MPNVTTKGKIGQLVKERAKHRGIIDGIRAACEAGGNRDPSEAEAVEVRAAGAAISVLDVELAEWRHELAVDEATDAITRQVHPAAPGRSAPEAEAEAGTRWIRTNDDKPATVARGQRFADHEVVRDHAARRSAADQAVIGQHGSFGHFVRAMTTTSGSAIVPETWAGDIIDRARARSACFQAGAELIPMETKQLTVGRLTGDPTAAFRAEGGTITASDPVLDSVTFDAKTMSTLVVGSLEWFQDADNADDVVEQAIAAALASHLDLMCLFGGLTTGDETAADALNATYATPPNPRGVLATLLAVAASSVLGGGANGTVQTATSFWREVQNAIYHVKSFNEEPNALLWPSKLEQKYVDAYDTTNQPLMMPGNISEMGRFATNQIPGAMTPGTGVNMADLFVGDWSQLLVGQRLGLTIQTLTERYAENGQVGIVAHWRGDVQLARPRAFSVFRYLQASA